jgi:hypothetical protein
VKSRQAISVTGKGFREELQCNGLSQFEIVRAIDLAHAAAAEQTEYAVAVREVITRWKSALIEHRRGMQGRGGRPGGNGRKLRSAWERCSAVRATAPTGSNMDGTTGTGQGGRGHFGGIVTIVHAVLGLNHEITFRTQTNHARFGWGLICVGSLHTYGIGECSPKPLNRESSYPARWVKIRRRFMTISIVVDISR